MGLRFSRRFHLVRSGALYQAMTTGEPQPNRKALRDIVRSRRLKNDRTPLETHPEFVPQAMVSVASFRGSDTSEQIADLIDNA